MYLVFKRWLFRIVSKKTLFRYEYTLRYFHYLLYKGNTYSCNICGKHLKSFIETEVDRLCPRCGSLQRTRRLWEVLNKGDLKPGMRILDFSPSRSIYRKFKAGNYRYTASDLSGDFISDVSFDITKIEASEGAFDLIICYHILEHIPDDKKAMLELYRVLANGGTCFVQTPFKDGNIYEDITIVTPEGREKHFGQSDHVRIYSKDALKDRLMQAGFRVEVNSFEPNDVNKFGFKENETILICKK